MHQREYSELAKLWFSTQREDQSAIEFLSQLMVQASALGVDKLPEAQLRLHPRKCRFAVKRVSFLGHLLTEQGIEVDPTKVYKVRDIPRPSSVHQFAIFIEDLLKTTLRLVRLLWPCCGKF